MSSSLTRSVAVLATAAPVFHEAQVPPHARRATRIPTTSSRMPVMKMQQRTSPGRESSRHSVDNHTLTRPPVRNL
jgi:hypothetical protein